MDTASLLAFYYAKYTCLQCKLAVDKHHLNKEQAVDELCQTQVKIGLVIMKAQYSLTFVINNFFKKYFERFILEKNNHSGHYICKEER